MIGIQDRLLIWIRLQCILLSKRAGIALPQRYLSLTEMDESPRSVSFSVSKGFWAWRLVLTCSYLSLILSQVADATLPCV